MISVLTNAVNYLLNGLREMGKTIIEEFSGVVSVRKGLMNNMTNEEAIRELDLIDLQEAEEVELCQ